MKDIVGPRAAARAQELEIQPLVLSEDVSLVKNRKQANEAKTLLVLANRPDRTLMEGPIDGTAEIETAPKKDFMHHRRSGLDQVHAQLLKDKGAAVVLSLRAVKHAKNPDAVLGRMLQNARIAKKLGVPLIIASFAETPEDVVSVHDQRAYWRAMGVDEKQVAQSQEALEQLLAQAKLRASDAYIAEGVTKTA